MKIALKALIGSHNYNLATESSDMDYKVFYVPSFDILYSGKIESKSVKEDGNDVEYHDIRRLPEFLKKANINFVEVLFSKEIEAFPYLQGIIFSLREDLARMNLPYLYKSSIGTATSRFNDYKKLKDKGEIDKANKQLANATRMLDFICRYGSNECQYFGEAIYYGIKDSNREYLLNIKSGIIDGEKYYESSLKNAESWKEFYMKQEFDVFAYELLNNAIKNVIITSIKDELQ